MDKLRYFLYFSLVLLVMSIICLIIVDKLTLEFYITLASVIIFAVIAVISTIMLIRRK